MSDSCYYSVEKRHRKRIDVIDEAWATDTLSDDEIPVPKDIKESLEQLEEVEGETTKPDTWEDLGLERFQGSGNKKKTLSMIAGNKSERRKEVPMQKFIH
eukprot:gene29945-36166_t